MRQAGCGGSAGARRQTGGAADGAGGTGGVEGACGLVGGVGVGGAEATAPSFGGIAGAARSAGGELRHPRPLTATRIIQRPHSARTWAIVSATREAAKCAVRQIQPGWCDASS
jgi:hypothetical protein